MGPKFIKYSRSFSKTRDGWWPTTPKQKLHTTSRSKHTFIIFFFFFHYTIKLYNACGCSAARRAAMVKNNMKIAYIDTHKAQPSHHFLCLAIAYTFSAAAASCICVIVASRASGELWFSYSCHAFTLIIPEASLWKVCFRCLHMRGVSCVLCMCCINLSLYPQQVFTLAFAVRVYIPN